MAIRYLLLFALLAAFQSRTALPHSGGTNADGCHTNRKTGDYHCHGSKPDNPDRVTYCHVINGERRCGYSRSTCDDLTSQYGGYCQRE
jgi:hypothetical protein